MSGVLRALTPPRSLLYFVCPGREAICFPEISGVRSVFIDEYGEAVFAERGEGVSWIGSRRGVLDENF